MNTSADDLRSARPQLIARAKSDGLMRWQIDPRISQEDPSHDKIFYEGFDPNGSPLGRPVYWRVIKRGDQGFYLSTVMLNRDEVVQVWGDQALCHCDPLTGVAVVQIETALSKKD